MDYFQSSILRSSKPNELSEDPQANQGSGSYFRAFSSFFGRSDATPETGQSTEANQLDNDPACDDNDAYKTANPNQQFQYQSCQSSGQKAHRLEDYSNRHDSSSFMNQTQNLSFKSFDSAEEQAQNIPGEKGVLPRKQQSNTDAGFLDLEGHQDEQIINQELNQQLLDFSIADASRAHENLVKLNETYLSMTCNDKSNYKDDQIENDEELYFQEPLEDYQVLGVQNQHLNSNQLKEDDELLQVQNLNQRQLVGLNQNKDKQPKANKQIFNNSDSSFNGDGSDNGAEKRAVHLGKKTTRDVVNLKASNKHFKAGAWDPQNQRAIATDQSRSGLQQQRSGGSKIMSRGIQQNKADHQTEDTLLQFQNEENVAEQEEFDAYATAQQHFNFDRKNVIQNQSSQNEMDNDIYGIQGQHKPSGLKKLKKNSSFNQQINDQIGAQTQDVAKDFQPNQNVQQNYTPPGHDMQTSDSFMNQHQPKQVDCSFGMAIQQQTYQQKQLLISSASHHHQMPYGINKNDNAQNKKARLIKQKNNYLQDNQGSNEKSARAFIEQREGLRGQGKREKQLRKSPNEDHNKYYLNDDSFSNDKKSIGHDDCPRNQANPMQAFHHQWQNEGSQHKDSWNRSCIMSVDFQDAQGEEETQQIQVQQQRRGYAQQSPWGDSQQQIQQQNIKRGFVGVLGQSKQNLQKVPLQSQSNLQDFDRFGQINKHQSRSPIQNTNVQLNRVAKNDNKNEYTPSPNPQSLMYGSEDEDDEDEGIGRAGFLDEFEQHQMNKKGGRAARENFAQKGRRAPAGGARGGNQDSEGYSGGPHGDVGNQHGFQYDLQQDARSYQEGNMMQGSRTFIPCGQDLRDFHKKGRQPNQGGGAGGKNKTAPKNDNTNDISDPDYKFGGSYFADFTDISGGVANINKSGSFADSNNVIKNKLGDASRNNQIQADNGGLGSQDGQSESSKKSVGSNNRNKSKLAIPGEPQFAGFGLGRDCGMAGGVHGFYGNQGGETGYSGNSNHSSSEKKIKEDWQAMPGGLQNQNAGATGNPSMTLKGTAQNGRKDQTQQNPSGNTPNMPASSQDELMRQRAMNSQQLTAQNQQANMSNYQIANSSAGQFLDTRVRTKAYKKNFQDLNNLTLQQTIKLQNNDTAIWVVKFRKDGKFMATGGQDHVLRIWQVQSYDTLHQQQVQGQYGYQMGPQQVPLLCPKPFKEWHNFHQSDIFEINWSPKDPSSHYLLSVSADCLVVIWNINFDKPIQILQHSDILCSALFVKPTSENYVASGCFDKTIRIWNVNQRKVIAWEQTPNYVTAMQINSTGDKLVVGLVDGICLVYDYSVQINMMTQFSRDAAAQGGSGAAGNMGSFLDEQYAMGSHRLIGHNQVHPVSNSPNYTSHQIIQAPHQFQGQKTNVERLKLERTIEVKNNNGKFSGGRKVTGIDFFNQNIAMVTTNDSRVRFVNIMTGRCIMKIKGNKNEQFHLRASLSWDQNYVICGSEDGNVYLWSQIEGNIVSMSQQNTHLNPQATRKRIKAKSNQLEYFAAFNRTTPVSAAIFAPKTALKLYSKLNNKMKQEFERFSASNPISGAHPKKPHQGFPSNSAQKMMKGGGAGPGNGGGMDQNCGGQSNIYSKYGQKVNQHGNVDSMHVNMLMVCCSTNGLIKVFKNEQQHLEDVDSGGKYPYRL